MKPRLLVYGLRHIRHVGAIEDIDGWVSDFFSHYGISLERQGLTLRIVFTETEHKKGYLGECWFSDPFSAEIFVYGTSKRSRRSVLSTLYHELDHVRWQLELERLLNGPAWTERLTYTIRPSEARAECVAFQWTWRQARREGIGFFWSCIRPAAE